MSWFAQTFDPKQYPVKINGDDCTKLMVMKSAAGYYIGRGYFDWSIGHGPLPYSRESYYYKTRDEAQAELDSGWEIRDCVENNWAYQNGHPHPTD